MEIYVLDKNFNKLLMIVDYSYAQYTEKFNELGNFQIQAVLNEDSQKIKEEGYYVLFDKSVCGIIQRFNPQIDEQTKAGTLILEGYLAEALLTMRCIPKSTSFTGTSAEFANKLVYENCVNPSDSMRALPISIDSNLPQGLISSKRQITGGEVESAVQEILDRDELGHRVRPLFNSTSITGLKFSVLKGTDRRVGNAGNLAPVVWSTDLKNVISGSYDYNTKDYKNAVYVAGEGEGASRAVRKVMYAGASGLDRYELYVDARDLQSTDEEGNVLSASEYNTVLDNRGFEKLNDCKISETYEANVSVSDDRYVYGEDFFLGDIVTLEDKTLGISIDSRLVAVQISDTRAETKIDLTFGNPKSRIAEKLKRKGVI